jgi:RNA polymerase sigma factor (sigma-70 family)
MMDDLKRRLAADVDSAFPDLVEAMQNRLYWGLRRMTGDSQQAEDLSQETFIRTYRALNDYGRDRIQSLSLEGWVWTIALNLGRNHLRDRSRRPTLTTTDERDQGVFDVEAADTVAWDRRLSQLNQPQRTAVVLKHVVGLSLEEISDATGRPTGTCKADIHRGLKKLREVMEAEDAT